jgi:AP-2 complex subunit alpha
MAINSMKKDLEDPNEIFNCLALHSIANIGSREMSETLSPYVHRLLTGNSKPFVKKKSALCLLRLYRKYPTYILASDWAPSIIRVLEDPDLGVLICTTSLIMALSQNFPADYRNCSEIVVNRLYKIVVEKEYSQDYLYYKVPIPWLQVKILRLLQYCPPSEDRRIHQRLSNVLHTIISAVGEQPKNTQHANAQNCVLFEAINLAIHLDPESSIVTDSTVLLGKFIQAKETNVRYLGLDAMAHLATMIRNPEALKDHQDIVILNLRDKDISVRRRALDLLYSLCDVSNARVVVAELLRVLATADYSLREEMVLKIAILTEKYATEYSWYVDTILQLIATAGDYVSEEVWYRVVQIVTNNEDLREYATQTVLSSLQKSTYHETAVKVGGYLLGEYGDRIVNLPNCTPIDQFTALHSKFPMCSLPTRSLLLTTYIKLLNLFPEIRNQVASVFNQYRHILDTELQQRACEYFTIASMQSEDLIQTICEEMPPFPERENTLLNSLYKKNSDTGDRRTWTIVDKDIKDNSRLGVNSKEADLLGMQENNRNSIHDEVAVPGSAAGANTEKLFEKSLFHKEGLLFEDAHFQLGFKSEYKFSKGHIVLYLGNKLNVNLTGMQINLSSKIPGLDFETVQPISSTVSSKAQLQHTINVECVKPYTQVPMVRITYVTNGAQSVLVKIPVVLTNFIEPVSLPSQDFFMRWKQLTGNKEVQSIFRSGLNIDVERVKKAVKGFHFKVLENVDPQPDNVVASGVIHFSQGIKEGCLLRIEPNLERQMYRVTVKCTNEVGADSIHNLITKVLSGKSL